MHVGAIFAMDYLTQVFHGYRIIQKSARSRQHDPADLRWRKINAIGKIGRSDLRKTTMIIVVCYSNSKGMQDLCNMQYMPTPSYGLYS